MVLGEILACPSAKRLRTVPFCLLDVDDIERLHRLKARNTHGHHQDMLNWAAWLRVHLQDPQWSQHVIKDKAWEGLDFSVWDTDKLWPGKVATSLINTTNQSIDQTVQHVAEWTLANSGMSS